VATMCNRRFVATCVVSRTKQNIILLTSAIA